MMGKSRLAAAVLVLTAGLVSTGATGQTPQTPATPAAATPPASEYAFSGGGGLMFFYVKAGMAGDFEAVMAKLKAAFTASKDSWRRQQANGIKVFKSTEVDPTGATVVYVWMIDPAVSTVDYDPIKLLNEASPKDTQPLFDKLKADVIKIDRMGLSPVLTMGIAR
jgi:hypothetical protein